MREAVAEELELERVVFVAALSAVVGIDAREIIPVGQAIARQRVQIDVQDAEVVRHRLLGLVRRPLHELGAGQRGEIAVTGGIDDAAPVGRCRPALGVEDDALQRVPLHEGVRDLAVEQDVDAGFLENLDDDPLHHLRIRTGRNRCPTASA